MSPVRSSLRPADSTASTRLVSLSCTGGAVSAPADRPAGWSTRMRQSGSSANESPACAARTGTPAAAASRTSPPTAPASLRSKGGGTTISPTAN
ncbi:MAG: hypothetical protein ACKOK8_10000, partial [Planctomycetia bacterium]